MLKRKVATMAIKITITHNINSVIGFLDDFKTKALVNAARMSMNKTVSAMRTQANRMAREVRKLKASELNQDYFKVQKAFGSDLSRMEASLEVSGRPMSLIRFVSGSQSPSPQLGIPVKQRQPVRVEVSPGRKVTLRTAFIAQGKSGNFHVFKRKGALRMPIAKQSAPSLAHTFEKEPFRTQLEKFGQQRLGTEFETAFNFQIEKIQRKNEK